MIRADIVMIYMMRELIITCFVLVLPCLLLLVLLLVLLVLLPLLQCKRYNSVINVIYNLIIVICLK